MDDSDEVIITVSTENGEMDCSVINTFEVEGKDYIALMPLNGEEILLFCYKELKGDTIELINIEDDFEFNKALEVFDSFIVDIE